MQRLSRIPGDAPPVQKHRGPTRSRDRPLPRHDDPQSQGFDRGARTNLVGVPASASPDAPPNLDLPGDRAIQRKLEFVGDAKAYEKEVESAEVPALSHLVEQLQQLRKKKHDVTIKVFVGKEDRCYYERDPNEYKGEIFLPPASTDKEASPETRMRLQLARLAHEMQHALDDWGDSITWKAEEDPRLMRAEWRAWAVQSATWRQLQAGATNGETAGSDAESINATGLLHCFESGTFDGAVATKSFHYLKKKKIQPNAKNIDDVLAWMTEDKARAEWWQEAVKLFRQVLEDGATRGTVTQSATDDSNGAENPQKRQRR